MIGLAGWVEATPSALDPTTLPRMLAAMAHRGGVLRTFEYAGFSLGVVSASGQEAVLAAGPEGVLAIEGWMRPAPGPTRVGGLEAFLAGARGEFAAVEWDAVHRKLIVARDPLGVRPIYVLPWQGGLAFSSEIGALLRHPRAGRDIHEEALPEFLAYRYLAGARTLVRGIQEVQPGRLLLWEDGRLHERTYWDLPYPAHPTASGGTAKLVARSEAALREATRDALSASPRTGVLLSGGLDSSLVAAFAVREGGGTLSSWSAGSEDPRLDESERAGFVARALGTSHVNRPISGDEYARALPLAIARNGQPLHHPNAVALLLVARDAATEVDALLMGEGADSSFGNRAALKARLALLLGRLPGPLLGSALAWVERAGLPQARAVRDLVATDTDRFALLSNQFTPMGLALRLAGRSSESEVLGERSPLLGDSALHPMSRLLRYYQRTELLASFNVFGKMLAASGVDARMPFGDRNVQEVTCAIPPHLKASLRGTAKPLLVRIARKHLPSEVVGWPKMSFGYPMAAWMRRGGPLAPYVRLLGQSDARTRALLAPDVLRAIVVENEDGRGNHGEGALFAAVNLEIWIRVCLEGRAPEDVGREASALATTA